MFSLTEVQRFTETQTEDGRKFRVLAGENHYKILTNGSEKVHIQGGAFYTSGGRPMAPEDVPTWVPAALERCTPESLIKVGLVKPKPVDPVDTARAALAALSDDQRAALLEPDKVAEETGEDEKDEVEDPL